MSPFKFAAFALTFLLSRLGASMGGQALFAPIEDFTDRAALVVVIEVKKVTEVTVSTGEGNSSNVYVAEAEVIQTLKSDLDPAPEKRTIALVGSTIPQSSAVWQPIETIRYLAFLRPNQGHYDYREKYDLRPIVDGKVEWIEQNPAGKYVLLKIDLEEALKKIQDAIAAKEEALAR